MQRENKNFEGLFFIIKKLFDDKYSLFQRKIKMKDFKSYRNSHTTDGKGLSYDDHYATIPWRRVLWDQEQRVLNSFIETYFKNGNINLLDFACGTGRITSFLEAHVRSSTGVDVSSTMLGEAKKKLKKTELIELDLTQDNILRNRKFNLITAFRFFLNAEPELRKEVMQLLASLLDRDGCLVFNNHRNRTSPLIWLRYIHRHKIKRENVNFMTISETRKLAKEAGLEIIRIYPVGLLPLPLVKPPKELSHYIDDLAMKFTFAGIFSESPIIVCRHLR